MPSEPAQRWTESPSTGLLPRHAFPSPFQPCAPTHPTSGGERVWPGRLLSVRPVFHPVSWFDFSKCGPCRPKQKTPSITMHYHPFAGAPGPPLAFQHVAPSVNNGRHAPNAVNGLLITNVRRTRRDLSAALALRRTVSVHASADVNPRGQGTRSARERERSQLVPATKACARARHPLVRLDPPSYTEDRLGRGAYKQAATPCLPLPSGPRPRQATGR